MHTEVAMRQKLWGGEGRGHADVWVGCPGGAAVTHEATDCSQLHGVHVSPAPADISGMPMWPQPVLYTSCPLSVITAMVFPCLFPLYSEEKLPQETSGAHRPPQAAERWFGQIWAQALASYLTSMYTSSVFTSMK